MKKKMLRTFIITILITILLTIQAFAETYTIANPQIISNDYFTSAYIVKSETDIINNMINIHNNNEYIKTFDNFFDYKSLDDFEIFNKASYSKEELISLFIAIYNRILVIDRDFENAKPKMSNYNEERRNDCLNTYRDWYVHMYNSVCRVVNASGLCPEVKYYMPYKIHIGDMDASNGRFKVIYYIAPEEKKILEQSSLLDGNTFGRNFQTFEGGFSIRYHDNSDVYSNSEHDSTYDSDYDYGWGGGWTPKQLEWFIEHGSLTFDDYMGIESGLK